MPFSNTTFKPTYCLLAFLLYQSFVSCSKEKGVEQPNSAIVEVFDITKTSARVVVTFDNDGGGNIIKNGVFKTLSD